MSETAIEIRTINTDDELYPQVYQLRETVLRQPLGLSLKDEDLSGDRTDTIIIAASAQKVLGCVMMKPVDDYTVKLRQMAIDPSMQQKGLGRKIVLAAEQQAWTMGFDTISLHARCSAADFYTKLGYLPDGDVFEEVRIPHILMKKHK